MTSDAAETAINECLRHMSQKLSQAAAIAKAACACAEADSSDQALQIALGVETLIFDAKTPLNAADHTAPAHHLAIGHPDEIVIPPRPGWLRPLPGAAPG